MMRRRIRGLVAGAVAFALVSAAAAGTAFSVNTVQSIAVANAATGVIAEEPCDGRFDISWTVVAGEIVGVRAVRIPPSTTVDPWLERCARQPYAVLVADVADVADADADGGLDLDHPAWSAEWTGVTSGIDAEIDDRLTPPASGPIPSAAGLAVQLIIGPGLLDRASIVQLTCEELGSGGTISEVVIGGTEYCLHVFDDVAATEEFEILDWRVHRVDHLIVGGGGGGAGRDVGGGGGAGGVVVGSVLLDPGETFPVVVGAGGSRSTSNVAAQSSGGNGASSSVFGIVALGGGGGSGWESPGFDGGSGGGGNGLPPVIDGVRVPVAGRGTEGQGFDGGFGFVGGDFYGGGGGGGASQPGRDAQDGRHGGDGRDVSAIFGTGIGVAGVVGGGGGGAGHRNSGNMTEGDGGAGGGGAAGSPDGADATPNTGGGGGASRTVNGVGGAGGSGIVVLRYPRT